MRREDRIAVLLPQMPETAIAHVAIYKIGAIAVPLFSLFGIDALEYRLADSGARAVITDLAGAAKLKSIQHRLPELAVIYTIDGVCRTAWTFIKACLARAHNSSRSSPCPMTLPSSSIPRARPAPPRVHCMRIEFYWVICRGLSCRTISHPKAAIDFGRRPTGRGSAAFTMS